MRHRLIKEKNSLNQKYVETSSGAKTWNIKEEKWGAQEYTIEEDYILELKNENTIETEEIFADNRNFPKFLKDIQLIELQSPMNFK